MTQVFLFSFIVLNGISFLAIPELRLYPFYLSMAALVGAIFSGVIRGRVSATRYGVALFYAAMAWVILTIPSLVISESPFQAIVLFGSQAGMSVWAFLAAPAVFGSTRSLQSYLKIWLAGITCVMGIGLALSLAEILPLRTITMFLGEVRVRYHLGFLTANYLGCFSLLGIVVVVRLGLLGIKKALLLIPFFTAALWLSGSRSSMLGFGVMVVLFCYLKLMDRLGEGRRFLILAAHIALVGMLVGLVWGISSSVGVGITGEQVSGWTSGRWDLWAAVLDEMRGVDWVTGKGLGATAESIIGRAHGADAPTFENAYVANLAQTGALGLLGMAVIALVALRIGLGLARKRVDTLALPLLAAWMVYSVFEIPFFTLANAMSVFVWADASITARAISAEISTVREQAHIV